MGAIAEKPQVGWFSADINGDGKPEFNVGSPNGDISTLVSQKDGSYILMPPQISDSLKSTQFSKKQKRTFQENFLFSFSQFEDDSSLWRVYLLTSLCVFFFLQNNFCHCFSYDQSFLQQILLLKSAE